MEKWKLVALRASAFAVFGALVLIGIGVNPFAGKSPKDEVSQATMPKNESAQDAEANRCWVAGQSLAKVYVANIAAIAEVGLMPSRVMDEGCAKAGALLSCIARCRSGFQSIARQAVGQ